MTTTEKNKLKNPNKTKTNKKKKKNTQKKNTHKNTTHATHQNTRQEHTQHQCQGQGQHLAEDEQQRRNERQQEDTEKRTRTRSTTVLEAAGRRPDDISYNCAITACGNGGEWWVQHQTRRKTGNLGQGVYNAGGSGELKTQTLQVHRGDVVRLVVGPKDDSHACDLTHADMTLTETGGAKRVWDLSLIHI